MGTSPGHEVSGAHSRMRTFVIVILAACAMADGEPKADADAYTFGQIAYGLPQANAYATGHPHNVGVVTRVDYGHGRVSGYGAIGNRGYAGYGGVYGGYSGLYGKREADSEPKADADAYTFGQIAYGLPQANAYDTGHPHNVGVVTGVDYGHGRVSGYGAIGNRGYAGHVGYAGYAGVYGGYSGLYGKR